jgi:Uncharacterised conserved protein (DUF2228)
MKNERQLLEEIYGFPFPESFFEFYSFIQELLSTTPQNLNDLMDMVLGQVFDVFDSDKITKDFNPIKTERYYKDPPEFFTILYGLTDGLHWGYYLDDPENISNICVVSYYHNDAFNLSINGHDIFEAFRTELESRYSSNQQYLLYGIDRSPDAAEFYHKNLESLDLARSVLMNYATQDRSEQSDAYTEKYWIARNTNAPTRDNMGIIVSPDLFRPLTGNDRFQEWDYKPTTQEVEELYRDAMKALEDGFPGTALKAGKDLWIYRDYFETTYKLLDAAYTALDRPLLNKTLKIAGDFRAECESRWPQSES